MRKSKAFTLIELIAVLVTLAILALIVTSLVLNIIRKARISADKRSIDAYGKEETVTYDAYEVGDEVTYNNVDYYVIKDSGTSEANVTLLKATPLTTAEVNQYGVGHVNRYTDVSVETAYDQNGYGGMAYYTSETCGYVNNNWIETDCTTDYKQSEVKYVVDAWKTDKAPDALEARIITYDDLTDNLGYEKKNEGTIYPSSDGTTPSWLYNSQYMYWTMSQYSDSTSSMWIVDWSGNIYYYDVDNCVYIFTSVVRPVITISKSFFN